MGESEQFSKFALHDTDNLSDNVFHIYICRLIYSQMVWLQNHYMPSSVGYKIRIHFENADLALQLSIDPGPNCMWRKHMSTSNNVCPSMTRFILLHAT